MKIVIRTVARNVNQNHSRTDHEKNSLWKTQKQADIKCHLCSTLSSMNASCRWRLSTPQIRANCRKLSLAYSCWPNNNIKCADTYLLCQVVFLLKASNKNILHITGLFWYSCWLLTNSVHCTQAYKNLIPELHRVWGNHHS